MCVCLFFMIMFHIPVFGLIPLQYIANKYFGK